MGGFEKSPNYSGCVICWRESFLFLLSCITFLFHSSERVLIGLTSLINTSQEEGSFRTNRWYPTHLVRELNICHKITIYIKNQRLLKITRAVFILNEKIVALTFSLTRFRSIKHVMYIEIIFNWYIFMYGEKYSKD